MLSLFQPHHHHRLNDAIDVLLRELRKHSRGGSGLTDQPVEISDSFHAEVFYGKRNLNPLLHCFTGDHRYLPWILRRTIAGASVSARTLSLRMSSAPELTSKLFRSEPAPSLLHWRSSLPPVDLAANHRWCERVCSDTEPPDEFRARTYL